MSRLRVADVDAVQQDGYLLARTASDAHVRLSTDRTALAHIHANRHLQQIVNTLYWRRLNLLAAQYSDHSRSLPQCKRCARTRYLDFVERSLLVRLFVVARLLRLGADVVCCSTGTLQCRNAQHADGDDASQTGKQGISLPCKLSEAEGLALIENWFVHIFIVVEKKAQKESVLLRLCVYG